MFIVIMKLSAGRERLAALRETHTAWVRRGLDDGVFLLIGGLAGGVGGAILAHGLDRSALDARLKEDPFVYEDVVRPEVFELTPGLADERLAFLVPA
jgi:uncharacterized protein YciI